jgi:galactokinase
MAVDTEYIARAFHARFGKLPDTVVRAPGRVNIIGEHTDYNDGFVLPMAVALDTAIAGRRRSDLLVRVFSENMRELACADLRASCRQPNWPWLDYLLGVAHELKRLGYAPTGADMVIAGDVPLGAGLSSSASFEMAACLLFETLGRFSLAGTDAAHLGRRVENEFLGLNSGIMDQFTARMAKANHALFIDCRTMAHQFIPLRFAGATFVILNTNAPHRLTGSKYNERVEQCRAAVAALNAALGRAATHLRDFTPEDLERARPRMDSVLYRRARHVVHENERTQRAARAMEAGDAAALGRLMAASHASLRDDYEVTFDPQTDPVDLLTTMVSIAAALPGCLGARMTGGGFGGSTINLVEVPHAENFAVEVLRRYRSATGLDGTIILSGPAAGAEVAEPYV